MRIAKIVLIVIVFFLLTALTQVGGVIYLLSFVSHGVIRKRIVKGYIKLAVKFAVFLLMYFLATFVIVPPIAKLFGRLPLPVTKTDNLRPLNILTCFLNRNYVKADLERGAFSVAKQMNDAFPGTTVNYLDASFPFVRGFPLLPHLSHNDGKKLDLSFFYIDKRTAKRTDVAPSFIGYGICEEPRINEVNTADFCALKGYRRYSFLKAIVPQSNKANFTFDSVRTKALINFFAENPSIGKIFIEPHLKARLKLSTVKIRFHGCGAVRHDDHLHVQLK
jgi:hypothetical protein